jgi:hypothetical protein
MSSSVLSDKFSIPSAVGKHNVAWLPVTLLTLMPGLCIATCWGRIRCPHPMPIRRVFGLALGPKRKERNVMSAPRKSKTSVLGTWTKHLNVLQGHRAGVNACPQCNGSTVCTLLSEIQAYTSSAWTLRGPRSRQDVLWSENVGQKEDCQWGTAWIERNLVGSAVLY